MKKQALAVSHSENVSEWVQALVDRQVDVPQRLVDLQQQLKMPLIEVWIAALLGGFPMEQRGSFYQTREVWVSAGEGRVNAMAYQVKRLDMKAPFCSLD